MTGRDNLDPNSLRSRLKVWLVLHPGWHPTTRIAEGLGITDPKERTTLIRELNRLADRGKDRPSNDGVMSYRPPSLPKRGPGTMYARVGTAPPSGDPTT